MNVAGETRVERAGGGLGQPRRQTPGPLRPTRRLKLRPASRKDPAARSIGEVAAWPKAPDSKSGLGASPTWVRLPPSPQQQPWRDARVAEGARLEIVCTERYRGFESLSLLYLIGGRSLADARSAPPAPPLAS